MHISYRTLGQNPAPPETISPYIEHPYRTGAGFIFGTIMSLGWVAACNFGVNYLRGKKATARRAKKRSAR